MVSPCPEVRALEEVCLWGALGSWVTGVHGYRIHVSRAGPSHLAWSSGSNLSLSSLPAATAQKGQVKGQEASMPGLNELSEPQSPHPRFQKAFLLISRVFSLFFFYFFLMCLQMMNRGCQSSLSQQSPLPP